MDDPVALNAYRILDTLEVPRHELRPTDYGRVMSNLYLLWQAAPPESRDLFWEQFIQHVTYPDDFECPATLFPRPVAEMLHYTLLMKAVEDIYNAYHASR